MHIWIYICIWIRMCGQNEKIFINLEKNSNWTSCNYHPIPFWSASHYHWPRKSLDVIWVVLGFQHHLPGSFASQSLISALKNSALVLNSWKIHHEFINLKFATNKKKAENDTLHLKIGHEEIQEKKQCPVSVTSGTYFGDIWQNMGPTKNPSRFYL